MNSITHKFILYILLFLFFQIKASAQCAYISFESKELKLADSGKYIFECGPNKNFKFPIPMGICTIDSKKIDSSYYVGDMYNYDPNGIDTTTFFADNMACSKKKNWFSIKTILPSWKSDSEHLIIDDYFRKRVRPFPGFFWVNGGFGIALSIHYRPMGENDTNLVEIQLGQSTKLSITKTPGKRGGYIEGTFSGKIWVTFQGEKLGSSEHEVNVENGYFKFKVYNCKQP